MLNFIQKYRIQLAVTTALFAFMVVALLAIILAQRTNPPSTSTTGSSQTVTFSLPTSSPVPDEEPGEQETPKLEFSGNLNYTAKKGTNANAELTFINKGILANTPCTLAITGKKVDGTSVSDKYQVQLPADYVTKVVGLFPGEYDFKLTCIANGETHVVGSQITVNETQATVCSDDQKFEIGETLSTAADIRAGIVGKWRGCAVTPFGLGTTGIRYAVEITFRADGTYSSRNYEKIVYPNTEFAHPAFYYDTDVDSATKTYALDGQLTSGAATGKIRIVRSATSSTSHDLKQLLVSKDKKKLSFDFYFQADRKITYWLERVE